MKIIKKFIVLIIALLMFSACENNNNKTITIDYNCDGINEYKCKTDEDNKLNCMIIIPKCGNSSFVGWYDSPDGGNEVNLDADFLEDTKIYAIWDNGKIVASKEEKKQSYKIKFNLNGGTGPKIKDITITEGDIFPNITNEIPSRNNYTFMGWYDNSNYLEGKRYYDEVNVSSSVYNLKKNLTLYAGWQKKNDDVVTPVKNEKYVVSFDANGGSGGQKSNINVEYGNSMPAISSAVPSNPGYKFMGWYDNNDYKKGQQYYNSSMQSTKKFDKKSDIVLYAGWSELTYNITFNLNGGTGKTTTLSVSYGNTLPTLSINKPSREGYTFVGWYDKNDYTKGIEYYDSNNQGVRNYYVASNITLYAGWSKNKVVQTDISTAVISSINKQNYTGKAITPKPKVTINNKQLEEGKDYTLNYKNNINTGTATIIINGIGDYKGSKQTTFIISNYSAVIKCENKTYNGNSQIIASCSGGTVSNEIQTNAGSYTINCTGDSNHSNAVSQVCEITPLDLSKASISAISNQKYTGSAITPAITVTLNGKTLVKNTDYTVIYSNNVNVGTATISIAGKSNYKGKTSTTFKIIAQTVVKPAAVITCANKVYTGSVQTIASCSGGTISNDSQINVGSYVVTCTGDVNHTNAVSQTCKITKASISNAIISAIANQNYTGSTITPTPVVKINNVTLKKDVDYTVTYKNNINPGTATITITGINNYEKSIDKTFIINPRITFNSNGGNGAMNAQNVPYNTSTSISKNSYTKGGYKFKEWNTLSNGSGTKYADSANINITNNITLYAQWGPNVYTITYNANGGSGAPSAQSYEYAESGTITLSNIKPTRSGYSFLGWATSSTATTAMYSSGQSWNRSNKGNYTLYAVWNKSTVSEKLKIYYLSLGRYDGFLIMGNGTTLFIDGGDPDPGHKCVEFLKSMGITKIDGLIGSHLHYNHIAAHEEIIDNFEVVATYYPDDPRTCKERKTCKDSAVNTTKLAPKLANIPVNVLTPQLNYKIGNLEFDILSPFDLNGSTNNNSLNMILKYGNQKFYFSGDTGTTILKKIKNTYDEKVYSDISIFKHPHHGQNEVPAALIEVMKPKYVIVPNTSKKLAGSEYKKVNSTVYALGSNKGGYVLAETDGNTLTVTDKR